MKHLIRRFMFARAALWAAAFLYTSYGAFWVALVGCGAFRGCFVFCRSWGRNLIVLLNSFRALLGVIDLWVQSAVVPHAGSVRSFCYLGLGAPAARVLVFALHVVLLCFYLSLFSLLLYVFLCLCAVVVVGVYYGFVIGFTFSIHGYFSLNSFLSLPFNLLYA